MAYNTDFAHENNLASDAEELLIAHSRRLNTQTLLKLWQYEMPVDHAEVKLFHWKTLVCKLLPRLSCSLENINTSAAGHN
jgi:hypothetical protein